MTPLVQATHLSKWYGQVSGLNDITVTIPPGITGLLGPNAQKIYIEWHIIKSFR